LSAPPTTIGVTPAALSFFTAPRKSSQVLMPAASTPACWNSALL
jgi:hypothetical protein